MIVKICGFTIPEHLADAAGMGLDCAGIVFWPGSPRVVLSRQRARELSACARGVGLRAVGVFVDEPVDDVATRAADARLDVVQLHGERPAGDVAALVDRGLCVWQALSTGPDFRPEAAREAWAAGAEAVLLDAWDPESPGGTGRPARWDVAAALAREGRLVLAGGLGADNVGEAIRAVRPWGVDASSRLERWPGSKDHVKMRAFLNAARRA